MAEPEDAPTVRARPSPRGHISIARVDPWFKNVFAPTDRGRSGAVYEPRR